MIDPRFALLGAVTGGLLGLLFIHLIGTARDHPVAATACLTLVLLPGALGALVGACKGH